jgi:hypothetical protein
MAGLNPTRLARLNYYAWREKMDAERVRFFRDKKRGFILELLSSSWDGYTGRVHCNYVLGRDGFDGVTVDYHVLEPLNDMEVIALCASEA